MSMDLEMLLARLRWPIATARWWTMQELAELLLSSEVHSEVAKRLLAALNRCRLEAEAVEVLCVFWIAVKQGYRPPSDLVSSVPRPSMLAAMLLSDMSLKLRVEPNPPLQMVPKDFEMPAKFLDAQGFGIPRIYLSQLEQLERNFRLPFVSQCAFEWSRTEDAYPEAPIQGDLGYFVRPFGDGFTGGFASRMLLRMITAYQRTLEVARVFWGAPKEVILPLLIETLPFDPTLAFLRPARPPWLSKLGKQVTADVTSVETFIGSILDAVSVAQPKSVLLSFVSPIYLESHEIVELSVVRWRQWGMTTVEPRDLAERFYSRQERWGYGVCQTPEWGLPTFVPVAKLESVVDHETKAAPMAATYGFNQIGYLQKDLYPSRLYYPVMTGFDGKLTVVPMGSGLSISSVDGQVATVYYWNAGWSPVHPKNMGGLCGTVLVGRTDSFQAEGEEAPDRHFYLWRLSRQRRTNDYESFVSDEPVCGVISQRLEVA